MVKLDIHAVAVLNYETGSNFGAYRRRKQLLVFQDVCGNLASPRCEIYPSEMVTGPRFR